ncbi:hypothetical protein Tco_0148697, partial [Tanacetum coccineum]
ATSLWARVIKVIHGVDGNIGRHITSGNRSCWTSIIGEAEVLKQQGVNVFDFMQLNMGNGELTSFWEDKWHDSFVLKDLFPRLYVLETNKKMSVGEKLKATSLDSTFRRKPRGGIEQSQYEELVHIVTPSKFRQRSGIPLWGATS